MEFEWDPVKEVSNITKHGLSFSDAATVFHDPLAVTYFDPDHSDEEDRFITIGTALDGQLVILSHTDRDEKIRIISARLTTRREKKLYEEGER